MKLLINLILIIGDNRGYIEIEALPKLKIIISCNIKATVYGIHFSMLIPHQSPNSPLKA